MCNLFFILKVETLKRLQNMRPFILTSEYTPSDSDIAILSKGPSFCYPFYPPKFVYLKNIYDFIRRIQWSITLKKHYFKSNNRFGKINSNKWISVDRITNATKKLLSIILNSSHNILNCYEPKSSAPKFSNTSVKICTADKGSNWVILHPQSYINEGTRQLSDNKFYSPLESSKSTRNMKSINHLILYLYEKKYITLSEKRFLLVSSDFNTCLLYTSDAADE